METRRTISAFTTEPLDKVFQPFMPCIWHRWPGGLESYYNEEPPEVREADMHEALYMRLEELGYPPEALRIAVHVGQGCQELKMIGSGLREPERSPMDSCKLPPDLSPCRLHSMLHMLSGDGSSPTKSLFTRRSIHLPANTESWHCSPCRWCIGYAYRNG